MFIFYFSLFLLFHPSFLPYMCLLFSRLNMVQFCPVLDHIFDCSLLCTRVPSFLVTAMQPRMYSFLLIGYLILVRHQINISEQHISRSALTRCNIICLGILRKIKAERHHNVPYSFQGFIVSFLQTHNIPL
jgi:hypothetical protein